jgi:ketosteroid isomerase-like protein
VLQYCFFTACQQSPQPVDVDLEAEETAARKMLDGFLSVVTASDVDSMATYLTEDALIVGTDPGEFWGKEQAITLWKQIAAVMDLDFQFIDGQNFIIAPDGNSAIALRQFYIPAAAPKIAARYVFYMIKIEGVWKVRFWETGMIPKNEDMTKLNEALAEEE